MRREARREKGDQRNGPGAGISLSRVMQQGQRDDGEEQLGASGKKKTSVGVGNLSGKWVLKGRCECY